MDLRRALVPTALMLALAVGSWACGGGEELPFDLESELVTGADRARAMAFAPDGRLFFAEQYSGAIRIVLADGQLQEEPFAQLQVANYADLDWGLTGLALDPDFDDNHYVYVFFTEPVPVAEGQQPIGRPKLVRFTEANGLATDETLISDEFEETDSRHAGYNANGRIHFGPDGMLYVSMGDYDLFSDEPARLADPAESIGKLLRIDPGNGSAPDDNPLMDDPEADPRVFASGFRDPFAFTFHPESETIYGADNTTGTCEELNIISEGEDYGWPAGEFPFADCSVGDGVDAIHLFSREGTAPTDFLSFVEVSGLVFVGGARYPSLGESLLVCESHRSAVPPPGNPQGAPTIGPGVLRRLVLGGVDLDQVSASDIIDNDCKGDLAVSADGTVYYANDSEIRRLIPKAPED